ncbi:MAG: CHRD domain-containing protein [Chloroflexi bacterium]|nr:CHRD domain-containing protein [Chloroflexota bacterium]
MKASTYLLLLLTACSSLCAQGYFFTQIRLTGDQNVPPVQTLFTANASISSDGTNLGFEVAWSAFFTPTGGGIYGPAPAGENGPLVIDIFSQGTRFFIPPDNTGNAGRGYRGTIPITKAQGTELFGGLWYIALATQGSPDGEIRAQIPAPPLITVHPWPKEPHIIQGYSVNFTASATGDPAPTFQWWFSSNSTNWWRLEGATSTNYTIASVQSTNAGFYRIAAYNANGTARSEFAHLVYFPSASTPLTNLVYTNETFQLALDEVSGYQYAIEASTNLADWVSIYTNQVPFTFTNSISTNYPQRFYRSRFLP